MRVVQIPTTLAHFSRLNYHLSDFTIYQLLHYHCKFIRYMHQLEDSTGNNISSYFCVFQEKAKKSKERNDWFTDLAHGKPLALLARKPPFFRKKVAFLNII